MPKENDLEGRQDMGGKHGGQAGMPKPESSISGAARNCARRTRDKSSRRTKVVLNNPAERIAVAIRLEISGHDRPTAAIGLAGIVQDEFDPTLHDLRVMHTALYNGMAADHIKVFATVEAAEIGFEENDPEGVAFEYDVMGPPA